MAWITKGCLICGGDLYYDASEGKYKCLQCSRLAKQKTIKVVIQKRAGSPIIHTYRIVTMA